MDHLARGGAKIAAALEQLPPEASGGGLEWHRPKRVAHLAEQRRQMLFKPPPIDANQRLPPPDFGPGIIAVEPRRDGRSVDQPVGLRKLRQAADRDATMPANKTGSVAQFVGF